MNYRTNDTNLGNYRIISSKNENEKPSTSDDYEVNAKQFVNIVKETVKDDEGLRTKEEIELYFKKVSFKSF